jgi:hypothetical protein
LYVSGYKLSNHPSQKILNFRASGGIVSKNRVS